MISRKVKQGSSPSLIKIRGRRHVALVTVSIGSDKPVEAALTAFNISCWRVAHIKGTPVLVAGFQVSMIRLRLTNLSCYQSIKFVGCKFSITSGNVILNGVKDLLKTVGSYLTSS
jgi:hypothetical protein